MSPPEMQNMLTSYYKVPPKKVPSDPEARKTMLRTLSTKKPRGGRLEKNDLSSIIENAIQKLMTTYANLGVTGLIPLDTQLKALAGQPSKLPRVYDDDAFKVPEGTSFNKASFGIGSSIARNKGSAGEHENADHAKPVEEKQKSVKVNRTVMVDGKKQKVQHKITDPVEVERILAERKLKMIKAQNNKASSGAAAPKPAPPPSAVRTNEENPLKISLSLNSLVRVNSNKNEPMPSPGGMKSSKAGSRPGTSAVIKINPKLIKKHNDEKAARQRRSQFGENELTKKRKSGHSGRRRRNGQVALNHILESVEKSVREAKGFVVELYEDGRPKVIKRVPRNEAGPSSALNLARPEKTGLDFTIAVTSENYLQVVSKPVALNDIRTKCKSCVYKSSDEFLDDMRLLASNAKQFNTTPDAYWVVQHAELLLEAAEATVEEFQTEIREAEVQILKEANEPPSLATTPAATPAGRGTPGFLSPGFPTPGGFPATPNLPPPYLPAMSPKDGAGGPGDMPYKPI
mmetsp:Transcript_1/g.13  ORF Transcript_1/g.13 Transcript_1/m.13 type:complete len:515 (+) Transcript_1:70-1614(+)